MKGIELIMSIVILNQDKTLIDENISLITSTSVNTDTNVRNDLIQDSSILNTINIENTKFINNKNSRKNYKSKFSKKVKKKYSLKDQRDDLERLELLLTALEAPSDYKKVYTKIFLDTNKISTSTGTDISNSNDISTDFISRENMISPRLDFNLSLEIEKEEEEINYYYDIDKGNLIWLNHNLSLLNKRNIKLIETLKLIQRILKKI